MYEYFNFPIIGKYVILENNTNCNLMMRTSEIYNYFILYYRSKQIRVDK